MFIYLPIWVENQLCGCISTYKNVRATETATGYRNKRDEEIEEWYWEGGVGRRLRVISVVFNLCKLIVGGIVFIV